MTEVLLETIVGTGAQCVILDVTGVGSVDTATTNHLIAMMSAAKLLGSYCVVTGVGPDIATTMVSMALDFGDVVTLPNLRAGLKLCLSHLSA